jgi:ferrous iron transport protein B
MNTPAAEVPRARADAVTVALVGRPNAGKTSVLMHLTGSTQRPVNFPGTSIERNESTVMVDGTRLRVVDLPGVLSLRALSRDEAVTLDYLLGAGGRNVARPDRLCAVLDASKLSVELPLLQQLRALGLPVVVALAKLDVAEAAGRPVAVDALRRALGIPVVVVDGLRGTGVDELRARLVALPPLQAPAPAGDDPGAALLAAAVQRPPDRRPSRSDRIDAFLLHPVLGPLLLGLLMVGIFQLVFTVAEPFVGWIETIQGGIGGAIEAVVAPGALRSFLVDGLVNGLGSAFVFLPQIALLIALVGLLESSGYMARAVFLLDRVMRTVGLSGKSFVPLSSSFACAIPGILASRILDDERDRLATIAVAPLMSCSARLPVYVVLLAAFFPPQQAGLILFGLYLLGIVTAFLVALVLRRTLLRGGRSALAMELPVYQRPSLRVVGRQVVTAIRGFLLTAGTVILVATVVVWGLSYFPRPAAVHAHYEMLRAAAPAGDAGQPQRDRLDAQEAAACLEQSWLASIGKAVQPVFAPAGFDWRLTVGILSAFPARELVVPTLGTLYSLGAVEADPDAPDTGLTRALREATDAQGRTTTNGLTALGLMAFIALCSQCAATLGAIRRETHSWFWPAFTFTYMTLLAWLAAVGIQQAGSALGYGGPG